MYIIDLYQDGFNYMHDFLLQDDTEKKKIHQFIEDSVNSFCSCRFKIPSSSIFCLTTSASHIEEAQKHSWLHTYKSG